VTMHRYRMACRPEVLRGRSGKNLPWFVSINKLYRNARRLVFVEKMSELMVGRPVLFTPGTLRFSSVSVVATCRDGAGRGVLLRPTFSWG
jgi:hypothetical protein